MKINAKYHLSIIFDWARIHFLRLQQKMVGSFRISPPILKKPKT